MNIKFKNIFPIFVITIVVGLIFIIISEPNYKFENTDCYDIYQHKIVGLTCQEKITYLDSYGSIGFFMLLLAFVIELPIIIFKIYE